IAAGRREVAGDLVAPRLIERVLHHGHELDMREAHAAYVVRQPWSELAVAQPAVSLFRHPHPRPQVHLVDGPRRALVVDVAAVLHPAVVAPVVSKVPDD